MQWIDFPEERTTLSDEVMDAVLALHLQALVRQDPPERLIFVTTGA